MNLNHILKKVGRGSSDDLNLHALRYPKSIFFVNGIRVKLSLNMMCSRKVQEGPGKSRKVQQCPGKSSNVEESPAISRKVQESPGKN
jgi:hypothetical protein